jgi:hypothetical protein
MLGTLFDEVFETEKIFLKNTQKQKIYAKQHNLLFPHAISIKRFAEKYEERLPKRFAQHRRISHIAA